MMQTKQVVVTGGGKNLFKVSENSGTYYVYQVSAGWITNSTKSIGSTRSFEDAITLIRSYTGRGIEKISNW